MNLSHLSKQQSSSLSVPFCSTESFPLAFPPPPPLSSFLFFALPPSVSKKELSLDIFLRTDLNKLSWALESRSPFSPSFSLLPPAGDGDSTQEEGGNNAENEAGKFELSEKNYHLFPLLKHLVDCIINCIRTWAAKREKKTYQHQQPITAAPCRREQR